MLRDAVRVMLREVMEAEVSAVAGAEWYERSAEREAQRNGYRPRGVDTRVGTIELAIPGLRTGRVTSRASWSPASAASRRWCRRRISMAFRPARVERLVE